MTLEAIGTAALVAILLFIVLGSAMRWVYPPPRIDPRTGRPFGDHGTAAQAIDFALDRVRPKYPEEGTFLSAWREGDLDEWPEFYEWLKARD